MRALLFAFLALLAGCANYSISASSAPASGTTVVSGANGVYVSTTTAGPAVFFAVMFGLMASQDYYAQPAPQLSASRTINEQDCTQPVESGGNLRCR
jgi:hypothetical protein